MPTRVRQALETELARAAALERDGDTEAAWSALERAHILSQRWVRPHLRVHAAMLAAAWRSRDAREIVGQVFRLALAAPGSLFDRAPLGNTGRSNVGAFTPMPLPADLAELLTGAADRRARSVGPVATGR